MLTCIYLAIVHTGCRDFFHRIHRHRIHSRARKGLSSSSPQMWWCSAHGHGTTHTGWVGTGRACSHMPRMTMSSEHTHMFIQLHKHVRTYFSVGSGSRRGSGVGSGSRVLSPIDVALGWGPLAPAGAAALRSLASWRLVSLGDARSGRNGR